jgi:eukaryotic-like serine/threonine-protein kinase
MKCPRCASPLKEGAACPRCLFAEIPEAETFAGLEVGEALGSGGMGQVFRARHKGLGRDVALKLLRDGAQEHRERLLREAKLLARIDHPNVVRVLDAGEEDGEAYLVMELVEGDSLARALPLPPLEALCVARAVGEGLAAAHAAGVVHRDIKPENVLVTVDGQVKVADFGIGRALDGGGALTAPNVAAGSPGYVAPEALKGAAPDARADVYGLGALLRAALTGQPPLGEPPPLPPGFDAVVRRAMAEDPAHRYADVRAMLRELDALAVRGAGLPADEALWVRAVAFLLAAAVGMTLWALVQSVTPRTLSAGEVPPLVVFGAQKLPDGSVLTRARFEVIAWLSALAAAGVALAAVALLRRHWRKEGLESQASELPLEESKRVLVLGGATLGVFLARMALTARGTLAPMGENAPLSAYLPVLGGLLEVSVLYVFLLAVLESLRRHRPLVREWKLWLGLFFALIPPTSQLLWEISR